MSEGDTQVYTPHLLEERVSIGPTFVPQQRQPDSTQLPTVAVVSAMNNRSSPVHQTCSTFPAQNLHLLSKAIEENESGTAVECDTSLKRVPIPTPKARRKSGESVSQSWKQATDTEAAKLPADKTKDDSPDDITDKNVNFIHHYQMTPLPKGFQPGPYDVLCGRGRVCKDAAGNKAYRDTVTNHLNVYVEADTKHAKGNIISNIMENVRQKCCDYHGDRVGGFIKSVNGLWYDVGDFLAREKTSQCFRDALAAHYSSSAQSKYLRRRAREANHDLSDLPLDMRSNHISRKNSLPAQLKEESSKGKRKYVGDEVRTKIWVQ
jgi:hypothetical protein